MKGLINSLCCCIKIRTEHNDELISSRIDGYDPCFSHKSAINDWMKDELDTSLIYSSLINNIRLKPYAIFYDKLNYEIIITIRGTLSLEDCITDVLAEPILLDEYESNDRYAHEGIYLSAKAIYEDMLSKNIFEKIELIYEKNALKTDELTQQLVCS